VASNKHFSYELAPIPRDRGLALDGYWVWCGSVIRGEDKRYHLFGSRWRRELPFSPNWVTNSEIFRASAGHPEGPFDFEEVVLPDRGPDYWDGMMTHNPTIHKHGDTYLLYYTGTTYGFDKPDTEHPVSHLQYTEAVRGKRIGLATSKSVYGPWERRDAPILDVRPLHWDASFVSNAAPCVREDGSVLLIYKGNMNCGSHRPMHLQFMGQARAAHWSGPYERDQNAPILKDAYERFLGQEDGYCWWNGEYYSLTGKDMTGGICGEKHGGFFAWSKDGEDWQLGEPPLAYSRKVRWEGGGETMQGQFERVQMLVADGRPVMLYAATGDGPGGFDNMTHTRNIAIPLVPSKD